MGIKVVCPNGHSLTVKNKFSGKSVKCPICKAPLKVPEKSNVAKT